MKNMQLKKLVLLALFVAVELLFRALGLGKVPVGPLNMSFLTVPIAVGAMLLGPMEGMALGAVFGLCSLWDAVNGSGGLTSIFFHNVSAVHTVILCVVTRALMGFLTGVIFKALRKVDKTRTLCYFGGALAAPLLNTVLFMGYMMLAFYHSEAIQEKVATFGTTNALMLIVLMVGVQGLIEMVVCTITAGTVSKTVSKAI
ncbi:MAG: ECF transporter S component [Clostridiales bacterium]|nr:ECF transporter S component [Clostridiales bacterium]